MNTSAQNFVQYVITNVDTLVKPYCSQKLLWFTLLLKEETKTLQSYFWEMHGRCRQGPNSQLKHWENGTRKHHLIDLTEKNSAFTSLLEHFLHLAVFSFFFWVLLVRPASFFFSRWSNSHMQNWMIQPQLKFQNNFGVFLASARPVAQKEQLI